MELSKKNWGNSMWKFLHVAAAFQEDTDAICDQIYLLCRVLPCPECRAHMIAHVQANPPRELINSIDDAGAYLFTLHNSVNLLLTPHKALMSIQEYEDCYGPINTVRVPKQFLDIDHVSVPQSQSKAKRAVMARSRTDTSATRLNASFHPTRPRKERAAAPSTSQMRKGHTIMWKDPENGHAAHPNANVDQASIQVQNRSAMYANNVQHQLPLPAYRPRARFANSLRMPFTSHL